MSNGESSPRDFVLRGERLLTPGKVAARVGWHRLGSRSKRIAAELSCARNGETLPRSRRLGAYATPKLLIVDEPGYLPFETNAAHLFFELVSRRTSAAACG